MKGDRFEPIADWSPAGRRQLVTERRDELRTILLIAFEDAAERYGGLAQFGFRNEDSVAEAADWTLRFFATADLDPAKLAPHTWELFSRPWLWLAMRVGRERFRRITERRESVALDDLRVSPSTASPTVPTAGAGPGAKRRLATTLRELRRRTCASIVGHWLRGTERLRAKYFDWASTESGEFEPDRETSKKTRSFHAHDAQFRFQCIDRGLIRDDEASPSLIAVRESMFQPCAESPPYRRPDEEVARILPPERVTGPRAIGMLRRDGLGALVGRLAGLLETGWRDGTATARDRLELLFLRAALAPTTIHALDLERRADLATRVQSLPALKEMEADIDATE